MTSWRFILKRSLLHAVLRYELDDQHGTVVAEFPIKSNDMARLAEIREQALLLARAPAMRSTLDRVRSRLRRLLAPYSGPELPEQVRLEMTALVREIDTALATPVQEGES